MGSPLHKLSLAEFLTWEETQEERNEFYKGETFAMVGGTTAHHRVIVNLTRRLDAHLDGTQCQEVLSPSIKGYDRRNKFVLYRQLASLREYVMIDPVTRVVETFSTIDSGGWLFTDQTRAKELELVSIGCKLPMEWLFKGIESEGS